MFGRLFPSEQAAQPSELPTPPARWRGWSRRRMSEPMWKEGASEALIRAITISVCLSPAVRHPAFSLHMRPHPRCSIPIRFPEAYHFKFALTYTFFHHVKKYTQLAWKLSQAALWKTTASFVSKQLWIRGSADSCQNFFDKQNRKRWITKLAEGYSSVFHVFPGQHRA